MVKTGEPLAFSPRPIFSREVGDLSHVFRSCPHTPTPQVRLKLLLTEMTPPPISLTYLLPKKGKLKTPSFSHQASHP